MANEAGDHTLSATALVHEAYLRLVGDQQFNNRGHFFAAASEAMRRVLVDHARNRKRFRRGGPSRRREELELDAVARLDVSPDDLLDLDAALSRLEREVPRAASLVKLRMFAGLTQEERRRRWGWSDGPPTATGRSHAPGFFGNFRRIHVARRSQTEHDDGKAVGGPPILSRSEPIPRSRRPWPRPTPT